MWCFTMGNGGVYANSLRLLVSFSERQLFVKTEGGGAGEENLYLFIFTTITKG